MGKSEQLAWERETGRWVGVLSVIAPVLLVAAIVVYNSSAVKGLPTDRSDLLLLRVNTKSGPFWEAAVLSTIGTALLAPILWFLYRAIQFRRAQIPRLALILAIVAPLSVAGLQIVQQAQLSSVASSYAKHPNPPPITAAQQQKLNSITSAKDYETAVRKLGPIGRADTKLTSGSLQGVRIAGEVTNLLLAGAFILIGLNAMRAGLMSRFLGILGIIIGVLYVIPIIGDPAILEFFWLIAIALVIFDRWPQGRGPAWASGEPIPWPTAQDRREEMEAKREGREPVPRRQAVPARASGNGRAGADPDVDGVGESAVATSAAPTSQSHPRSKKRKKKRRG